MRRRMPIHWCILFREQARDGPLKAPLRAGNGTPEAYIAVVTAGGIQIKGDVTVDGTCRRRR